MRIFTSPAFMHRIYAVHKQIRKYLPQFPGNSLNLLRCEPLFLDMHALGFDFS